MEFYRDSGAIPYHLRSPDQIARFFDGLELVEPGVVTIDRWYSGPTTSGEPAQGYGGIARKP